MSVRTPDPNPGWLSEFALDETRGRVPILYVEAVPVRLDPPGQVEPLGVLLRGSSTTGELTRTILAVPGVQSARVHIGASLRSGLARSDPAQTASVTLSSAHDLTGSQAQGIQYLVALAVSGLSPDEVAVIDLNKGILAGPGVANAEQAGVKAETQEAQLEQKILRLLEARTGTRVEPGRTLLFLDEIQAALPAGPLFRLPGDELGQLEGGVVVVGREVRRVGEGDLDPEVVTPRLDVDRAQEFGGAGEGTGRPDDVVHGVVSEVVEQSTERDPGEHVVEGVRSDRVVGLVDVPGADTIPVDLGEPGLEGAHPGGPAGGEPQVTGWLELARLYPSGLTIRAKLDTGARTSSLNATHATRFFRGDEAWVRFDVTNARGRTSTFERPAANARSGAGIRMLTLGMSPLRHSFS